MSKQTFADVDTELDLTDAIEVLRTQRNERGYELTAIRMPYYETTLEFVQVDFPDGTSAYFKIDRDIPEGFCAGPFGGGYAWNCPKYVVEAAGRLLTEVFPEPAEALL